MEFRLYNKNEQRELPVIRLNPKVNDPSLYIPSEGLIDAVNVALHLGQPLLVTGEPGSGKTELAAHVAWIFGLGEPLEFRAQTTSGAQDLFYRYDALAHFQYSQTNNQPLTPDKVEELYIQYQGLGQAIRENRRAVVLIDEIDKAPRDLPNDVLRALEKLEFTVPQIGGKAYRATEENRPIIIMTSNSEKNLPEPFLRRVAYYHIPYPSEETLLEILKAKTEGLEEAALKAAIAHFEEIRSGKLVKLQKKPATAELIYWALLLHKLQFDASKLKGPAQLTEADKKALALSYSVLAKTREDLGALGKTLEEGR